MNEQENNLVRFTLHLTPGPETTAEERQALRQRLRDLLWESDAHTVQMVRRPGPPPAGTKGEPLTTGAVLVAVAAAALPGVLSLIQQWLLRQRDQTFKVTIGDVNVEVPRNASRSEIMRIAEVVQEIEADRRDAS